MKSIVSIERETIANKARQFSGHYPEGSDGRNTFILLAEWIEQRDQRNEPVAAGPCQFCAAGNKPHGDGWHILEVIQGHPAHEVWCVNKLSR